MSTRLFCMLHLLGCWQTVLAALGRNNATYSGQRVTIVSILLGDVHGLQYRITAPTYDVGFEDAESMFPGFLNRTSQKGVTRLDHTESVDDVIVILYEELGRLIERSRNNTGLTVWQTPANTPLTVILGDLAREFNVPLFISSASGSMFLDRTRFPTVIKISPFDNLSLRDAGIYMLKYYNWTTVTLLCAENSPNATVNAKLQCPLLENGLRSDPRVFTVHKLQYMTGQVKTYAPALRQAKLLSRVVVLIGEWWDVPDLMTVALDLEMTNGDFAFLAPFQAPELIDKWRAYKSWQPIFALPCLLLYATEWPDMDANAGLVDRILRLSETCRYGCNDSIPAVSPVQSHHIAAYQGVISVAQTTAFSRSLTPSCPQMTTDEFMDHYENQTFNFGREDVYFDGSSNRRLSAVVVRLDNSTMAVGIGWRVDIATSTVVRNETVIGGWVAPANRPLCGYRGDRCPGDDTGNTVTLEASVSVAVLLAAVVFACFGFIMCVKVS